ncbi:MAG: septal ring lytic transglycosylase RlpA family protein [Woeseiaceae bacterium]|nr:septal ring lytic transglycosylase RlpA family protein [Woeseiaceae bacterium]
MGPSARVLVLVLFAAALGGCGSAEVKDSAPKSGSTRIPDLPDDPVPRPLPRSKYGNMSQYEVFGKQYRVMQTSSGYKERGVASWYGTKFHGRLTSSREPYDMYQMTAAHKTLPLPTFVRVRNLSNGREIIVKVNDRGPFAHNRIIDLSYAAALKLDMVTSGTSLVEVEAISFDDPPGDRPVRKTTTPQPAPVAPAAPSPKRIDEDHIFLQVGAFGSRDNAHRRRATLEDANIPTVFVVEDTSVSPSLYRVRIGPIRGIVQYDIIVEELENLGIADPYLINE